MTCCGFEIISPDRAIAWCDTESYVDDAPGEHVSKLAVNPFASLLAVGAGLHLLIRAAAMEIAASRGFDHSEIWLPPALKQAARQFGGAEARSCSDSSVTIGLVGFSQRLGRLVGAVVDQAATAPIFTSRFSSPSINEFVDGEDAVIAAVNDQMEIIRRQISTDAGAGAVLMAEINGPTITVRPIFDLARGLPIRRAREFTAAISDRRTVHSADTGNITERGRLAGSMHSAARNFPFTSRGRDDR